MQPHYYIYPNEAPTNQHRARRLPVFILVALLAWIPVGCSEAPPPQQMPITTSSEEARQAYLEGLAFMDTSQPESARPLFEQALALDPSFLLALDGLRRASPTFKIANERFAELLLKLGRFEESITYYDKALEREPLFPSAQIGIAASLILQGKHTVARERLQRLYDIAPHDGMRSGIHWARAVTYLDEGRLEEALAALEQNYALSEKGHDLAAMALDLTNMVRLLAEAER